MESIRELSFVTKQRLDQENGGSVESSTSPKMGSRISMPELTLKKLSEMQNPPEDPRFRETKRHQLKLKLAKTGAHKKQKSSQAQTIQADAARRSPTQNKVAQLQSIESSQEDTARDNSLNQLTLQQAILNNYKESFPLHPTDQGSKVSDRLMDAIKRKQEKSHRVSITNIDVFTVKASANNSAYNVKDSWQATQSAEGQLRQTLGQGPHDEVATFTLARETESETTLLLNQTSVLNTAAKKERDQQSSKGSHSSPDMKFMRGLLSLQTDNKFSQSLSKVDSQEVVREKDASEEGDPAAQSGNKPNKLTLLQQLALQHQMDINVQEEGGSKADQIMNLYKLRNYQKHQEKEVRDSLVSLENIERDAQQKIRKFMKLSEMEEQEKKVQMMLEHGKKVRLGSHEPAPAQAGKSIQPEELYKKKKQLNVKRNLSYSNSTKALMGTFPASKKFKNKLTKIEEQKSQQQVSDYINELKVLTEEAKNLAITQYEVEQGTTSLTERTRNRRKVLIDIMKAHPDATAVGRHQLPNKHLDPIGHAKELMKSFGSIEEFCHNQNLQEKLDDYMEEILQLKQPKQWKDGLTGILENRRWFHQQFIQKMKKDANFDLKEFEFQDYSHRALDNIQQTGPQQRQYQKDSARVTKPTTANVDSETSGPSSQPYSIREPALPMLPIASEKVLHEPPSRKHKIRGGLSGVGQRTAKLNSDVPTHRNQSMVTSVDDLVVLNDKRSKAQKQAISLRKNVNLRQHGEYLNRQSIKTDGSPRVRDYTEHQLTADEKVIKSMSNQPNQQEMSLVGNNILHTQVEEPSVGILVPRTKDDKSEAQIKINSPKQNSEGNDVIHEWVDATTTEIIKQGTLKMQPSSEFCDYQNKLHNQLIRVQSLKQQMSKANSPAELNSIGTLGISSFDNLSPYAALNQKAGASAAKRSIRFKSSDGFYAKPPEAPVNLVVKSMVITKTQLKKLGNGSKEDLTKSLTTSHSHFDLNQLERKYPMRNNTRGAVNLTLPTKPIQKLNQDSSKSKPLQQEKAPSQQGKPSPMIKIDTTVPQILLTTTQHQKEKATSQNLLTDYVHTTTATNGYSQILMQSPWSQHELKGNGSTKQSKISNALRSRQQRHRIKRVLLTGSQPADSYIPENQMEQAPKNPTQDGKTYFNGKPRLNRLSVSSKMSNFRHSIQQLPKMNTSQQAPEKAPSVDPRNSLIVLGQSTKNSQSTVVIGAQSTTAVRNSMGSHLTPNNKQEFSGGAVHNADISMVELSQQYQLRPRNRPVNQNGVSEVIYSNAVETDGTAGNATDGSPFFTPNTKPAYEANQLSAKLNRTIERRASYPSETPDQFSKKMTGAKFKHTDEIPTPIKELHIDEERKQPPAQVGKDVLPQLPVIGISPRKNIQLQMSQRNKSDVSAKQMASTNDSKEFTFQNPAARTPAVGTGQSSIKNDAATGPYASHENKSPENPLRKVHILGRDQGHSVYDGQAVGMLAPIFKMSTSNSIKRSFEANQATNSQPKELPKEILKSKANSLSLSHQSLQMRNLGSRRQSGQPNGIVKRHEEKLLAFNQDLDQVVVGSNNKKLAKQLSKNELQIQGKGEGSLESHGSTNSMNQRATLHMKALQSKAEAKQGQIGYQLNSSARKRKQAQMPSNQGSSGTNNKSKQSAEVLKMQPSKEYGIMGQVDLVADGSKEDCSERPVKRQSKPFFESIRINQEEQTFGLGSPINTAKEQSQERSSFVREGTEMLNQSHFSIDNDRSAIRISPIHKKAPSNYQLPYKQDTSRSMDPAETSSVPSIPITESTSSEKTPNKTHSSGRKEPTD